LNHICQAGASDAAMRAAAENRNYGRLRNLQQ
jgi:hypothetical protein